jgi:hypothetical protein
MDDHRPGYPQVGRPTSAQTLMGDEVFDHGAAGRGGKDVVADESAASNCARAPSRAELQIAD